MKQKLNLKKLGIFIILFMGIFISSCTKEDTFVVPETNLGSSENLKVATVPNMICDLIAGQNINVGQVMYSYDGGYLYVTYKTTSSWMITEVHLFIGTQANFILNCTSRKAVQIGHFPYSASNLNTSQYDFDPIAINASLHPKGIKIVAHAIVKNESQTETAFANCSNFKPLIAVKSGFSSNLPPYACSEGDRFGAPGEWCYDLGTNLYEKDAEYLLRCIGYTIGSMGHVFVTDDGINMSVIVYAEPPSLISASYLYVGSMKGLINYIPATGTTCPKYDTFPWIDPFASPGRPTSVFTVPMPNISFQDAFDSNRWGWINHFYF